MPALPLAALMAKFLWAMALALATVVQQRLTLAGLTAQRRSNQRTRVNFWKW